MSENNITQHGAGEPVKTLRDEMAMAALVGYMAGQTIHDKPNLYAVKMADAMLAARQKVGE